MYEITGPALHRIGLLITVVRNQVDYLLMFCLVLKKLLSDYILNFLFLPHTLKSTEHDSSGWSPKTGFPTA